MSLWQRQAGSRYVRLNFARGARQRTPPQRPPTAADDAATAASCARSGGHRKLLERQVAERAQITCWAEGESVGIGRALVGHGEVPSRERAGGASPPRGGIKPMTDANQKKGPDA
jgi:hypothetical protein